MSRTPKPLQTGYRWVVARGCGWRAWGLMVFVSPGEELKQKETIYFIIIFFYFVFWKEAISNEADGVNCSPQIPSILGYGDSTFF